MRSLSLCFVIAAWISSVLGWQPSATSSLLSQRNSVAKHSRWCGGVAPLQAKKGKNKFKSKAGGMPAQEKQSVKDQRFEEETRSFIYTMAGLTKTLPDGSRTILKGINLCFYPGAKIGVVGLNGSGKSTMLKIMAGIETEFEGVATPRKGTSVGYLAQEPTLEGETVDDAIAPAVKKARAPLDRFEALSVQLSDGSLEGDALDAAMEELGKVQETVEALDLWDLDRRVEQAKDALRCPPGDAQNAVLSGGEKRRVALCRLLLEGHDLLLLDEPTNHLDVESIAWLERYLATFAGTVVSITHDRYFLENVAQYILELDRGEGIPFEGNYAQFLEQKSARLGAEKRVDSAQQKFLARELEWVRSSPKARATKSKARMGKYEELVKASAPPEVANEGRIYIPPGPRLGGVVVEAKGLSKSLGGRQLFSGLDFELPPGGIVGVIGPNGAGKSTLVKMMLGKEVPDAGTIRVGDTAQIIAVNQTREALDEVLGANGAAATVFDVISGGADNIELGTASVMSRAYCSWFGFRGAQQQARIATLSGGERGRCQLAVALRAGGNVLLLDEPTNDLDVGTLEALEEALLGFGGCAVVVSHDRFFLDKIATHILAFEGNGEVVYHNGNYQEYESDRRKRAGLSEDDDSPKGKFRKLEAIG